MRVLLLSPYPERIATPIIRAGDAVLLHEGPLTLMPPVEFIVSYGYRHMIREPVLSAFKGRIINLHISYLPWNRGADPNFWSWVEGTPKGVTIHEIDAGLDTGGLIAQREVSFQNGDTLSSSYEKLNAEIVKLFSENWPLIRSGYETHPYSCAGSFHFAKERKKIWGNYPLGWETPVSHFKKC